VSFYRKSELPAHLLEFFEPAEMGLEQTPDAYVAEMVAVFRECRRVLRNDGTLWLNLGDTYTSGGRAWRAPDKMNEGRAMNYRPDTPEGLKPKDLVGIPWRVAFALQADGWYLRQDIIWAKSNPMPESVRDRCTKSHEYVFLLSKSRRYFYDLEAVSEPASRGADGSLFNAGRTASHQLGRSSNLDRVDRDNRNRRSVWTIATEPSGLAHFAMMPPALAELCIRAGTSEKGCCPRCGAGWVRMSESIGRVPAGNAWGPNAAVHPDRKEGAVGGLYRKVRRENGWLPSCSCLPHKPMPSTVLDPFAGAGTTGLVADRLGRNAILIELNPSNTAMARQRLEGDAGMFASVLEAAE
jgi:DNA modification methylase